MTVAIVHYHLGPGGVTQVIAAASRAFTAAGIRHVILAGSAPPDSPLPVRIIPALAYPGRDRPPGGPSDDSSLTDQLRAAGLDHLGSPPDIWHFHNHSLGKNQSVPRAVAALAAENERLILQLHDLAEDGRPANHPFIAGRHDLYPFSPRIRYAFLNSRDLATFQNAGLPPQNATLLSNPIPIPASTPPLPSVSPILFAPVRGIRR